MEEQMRIAYKETIINPFTTALEGAYALVAPGYCPLFV